MAFARQSVRQLQLDGVVFLPDFMPSHKPSISPVHERIGQLTERLANEPLLSACESPRHEFSFAQTLPYLSARYPDTEFIFLVGSDVALGLSSWPDIENLPNGTQFAIGLRSDCDEAALLQSLQHLPSQCIYEFVHTPHAHLRSSHIRTGN